MNIDKVFKEQVESNMTNNFISTTMTPTRKVLRKENTNVSLMMFYENRKKMIFKVLSSVVYCIMDNYIYVDYLCCLQNKLHVNFENKGFENTTYNAVSGIEIPELLINIISCHGFVNDKRSSLILSCRKKLVDYYLSKGFVLHNNIPRALNNVPQRVKHIINAEDMYKNYFVMA